MSSLTRRVSGCWQRQGRGGWGHSVTRDRRRLGGQSRRLGGQSWCPRGQSGKRKIVEQRRGLPGGLCTVRRFDNCGADPLKQLLHAQPGGGEELQEGGGIEPIPPATIVSHGAWCRGVSNEGATGRLYRR